MPPKKPRPQQDSPPVDMYIRVPADEELQRHLTSIGARSDRGRSPWNRSNVLRRELSLFCATLDYSDPRKVRKFPQKFYDLTLNLLTDPWALDAQLIWKLPIVIQALFDFDEQIKASRVDRDEYLRALGELTFAERLHLVEAAQVLHAPTEER